MAHRVSVNFSDNALSTLEKLAHEKGKSMSDVLRDAIVLENYVTEASREGSKIFIERPDGKIRELLTR
jgi:metal-responsive CopG/Arc/MetJ family transcriptional regulator